MLCSILEMLSQKVILRNNILTMIHYYVIKVDLGSINLKSYIPQPLIVSLAHKNPRGHNGGEVNPEDCNFF